MKQTTTSESVTAPARVNNKSKHRIALAIACTIFSLPVAAQSISISGTVYNDADGGTISGTPIGMVNNQALYVYLIDSTGTVVDVDTVNATTGTFSAFGTAFSNYNVALSTSTFGVGAVYPNLGLPNNYVPTAEGTTSIGDGTPDFAVAINSASSIVINYAINARPEGYSFVLRNPTRDSLDRIEIPSDAFRGEDKEDGNYVTGLTGRKVDLYQATGGALYYNDTLISFSSANSATRFSNFQSSSLRFVPATSGVRAFAYSILDNAGVVELVPNSVSISVPLPVNMTSFYGIQVNTGNRIFWNTATESGSAGFELQRSTDGFSFKKVAYVNSQAEGGRSQQPLTYSTLDNTAAELEGATVFYRLRQIDLNGESMVSNTIRMGKAGAAQAEMQLSAYPNPCSTMLSLDLASGTGAAAEMSLSLSTATGQLVQQTHYHAATGRISSTMDVSSLPAGQYFLRLEVSGAAAKSTPIVIAR